MKIRILYIFILISNIIYAQNNLYLDSKSCPFQLSNIEAITSGETEYTLPKISPDGSYVMFTKKNKSGIYLIDLKNRNIIKTIADDSQLIYDLKWTDDSNSIIFKKLSSSNKTLSNKEIIQYSIENDKYEKVVSSNNKSVSNNPLTIANEKIQIYYNLDKRLVEASDEGNNWFITKEPGLYYNFILSPDRTKVIIHGENIYVYSIDGKNKIDTGIEKGLANSWSPDGNYFIYFVDEDKGGHQILESDLYISSFDGKNKWKITDSQDLIELWPSWVNDLISFEDLKTGQIYLAKISKK